MSETTTPRPNLVQIRPRELVGKWVKYVYPFWELAYRLDPSWDFRT